ncbi:MAG: AbrB/MazE/SpoVT family DNA-binding domain-containing protein [Nanoarchaeota archaeon]|nr:AbrB/MazE/SpoVT family DNA-binding domain-containing protein [Nanoarchaeota archaeon]
MEITKVSTKGQIVIPQGIRKELGIESGTSMLVTKMKDYVVLRKMNLPNVQQAFKSLAKEIEKQFKSNKITRKDIDEAVSWARKG